VNIEGVGVVFPPNKLSPATIVNPSTTIKASTKPIMAKEEVLPEVVEEAAQTG